MFAITALFAVLFICALPRDASSETTCQTHKRNSASVNSPVKWDIQCDAQGNYLPLQCTIQTPKWCACYDKEDMVAQPSKATKSCECHLARAHAIKSGKTLCETPVCERNGHFQKKQCCDITRECRCVDPVTGQNTVQPQKNLNLHCP
ncbi:U24-ctenitoxin-Pn1a-like [Argiope bruennichi]|uniref:U24-ctenitoxin-Pn1a like protein n=1 Tax=Argiope bruennichi TaxID=94029 RepID=A0A8T0EFS3_ARGBR|nr:U24-ctenitoxin-Pn1a-like [Argiope bruennichi]KAF8771866.1 U24-ctenitoxin-Pn1a like protein [Argiope bruennichi]